MFKFISASFVVEIASSCECDAQLSWPDTNCYTLSKTYDCSGCSVCVLGYDKTSYQVEAWTESVNQIRALFKAPPLTWSQDIASDVYQYLLANEYDTGAHIWDVEHSCDGPEGQSSPDCSYKKTAPLGPAGENIAVVGYPPSSCAWVPDLAMYWAAESLLCQKTDCSDAGAAGHFTAMTWKGAQTFGCATTEHDVTMCRFKGDDTEDCSTPNLSAFGSEDCVAENVNDWKWFTFDKLCGLSSLQYNSSLSV